MPGRCLPYHPCRRLAGIFRFALFHTGIIHSVGWGRGTDSKPSPYGTISFLERWCAMTGNEKSGSRDLAKTSRAVADVLRSAVNAVANQIATGQTGISQTGI